MKNILLTIAFSFVVFISSCSQQEFDINKIDAVVSDFHESYNKKKDSEIYDKSNQGMKNAISKDEFIKTFNLLYKVLGEIKKSSLTGVTKTTNSKGEPVVAAQYTSEFSKGTGIETFILIQNNNSYEIFQWNINSDELIKGMVEQASKD